MLFSLYKATKSLKKWGGENRLLEILIEHNIFYFACGLCEEWSCLEHEDWLLKNLLGSSVLVILTTALMQVRASSLLEICVDVASQGIVW